jgi:hypothetical protein
LLAQLLARGATSEQALRILDRGLTDDGPSADLLVLQSSLLSKRAITSSRSRREKGGRDRAAELRCVARVHRGAGALRRRREAIECCVQPREDVPRAR